jgi:hypothetical protein
MSGHTMIILSYGVGVILLAIYILFSEEKKDRDHKERIRILNEIIAITSRSLGRKN